MNRPFPDLVSIGHHQLAELSERARQTQRLRQNLNVHARLDDPVNRLLNAVEPGSYVRPHRHSERSETLLAVRGSFDVVFFDDDGCVLERSRLGGQGALLLEYPPNTWHTLTALEPGSVFFEVKRGPYTPAGPEDFLAGWPPENSPEVELALAWLARALPGQKLNLGA